MYYDGSIIFGGHIGKLKNRNMCASIIAEKVIIKICDKFDTCTVKYKHITAVCNTFMNHVVSPAFSRAKQAIARDSIAIQR